MDRFHDRTALVTGASKGIGRAIAIRLASEGAHVAVNFNEDEDGAGRVVEQIIACGGNAFPVQADVGAPGDIEAMFTVIAEKLGRLDVLVNNAGIYRSRPIEELDAAEFDRHFHTRSC